MVEVFEKEGGTFFKCPLCNHVYKKRELAELCEQWCKVHEKPNEDIKFLGESLKDM